MAQVHYDVEFHVTSPSAGLDGIYTRDFNEAAARVASRCVACGRATLDVLIYSRAGAHAYGGDDAEAQYDEDPQASVFERFEFTCNNLGRVP